MLVEVIRAFEEPPLARPADTDLVDHREVLHVLAQPDAARVRPDRDAELVGEEQHREELVHAAQPAGVGLGGADRPAWKSCFQVTKA